MFYENYTADGQLSLNCTSACSSINPYVLVNTCKTSEYCLS